MSEWRRQLDDDGAPTLQLLLSTFGEHRQAVRAVRAAVEEVHHDCESGRLKDGSAGAPLYAGEWVAVRVPDGVVVQVHDCDALEAVLRAVATNLARRGIEGQL